MPHIGCFQVLLLACVICGVHMQWTNGNNEWNSNSITNCPLQPGPSPAEYWHVDQYGRRYARRCPPGQAFFTHKCACDHSPPPCDLKESERGPRYYEQYSNGYWYPMPCPSGTAFNPNACGCTLLI